MSNIYREVVLDLRKHDLTHGDLRKFVAAAHEYEDTDEVNMDIDIGDGQIYELRCITGIG